MRASLVALGAIAVLAAVLPVAANAQYRSDTPEVIAPAPPPPDRRYEDVRASREAYRLAGEPRIVVFLNRQLSDRITNDYDEVVIREGAAALEARSDVSRSGRSREGSAVLDNSSQTRRGRREVTDDARGSILAESEEWRFLDAFDNQLQGAGIKVVDRNLAMRLVAAQSELARDKQTVEMEGIAEHADLMMTVLHTSDPDAPLGVLFRISVIDLATGIVRTSLTSDGSGPSRGPGRFVAGPDGFERQAAPGLTIRAAGANIAMETIRQMASRW